MFSCVHCLQPFLALLFSGLITWGQTCPSSCFCSDPHTVNCTGQGLTHLPNSIPLDTRRLVLSNNWIALIPPDFLVLYSDLVYLDLRNNSLTRLEPGTLTTASRLVYLDLGGNNLTDIPSGTFKESRSLIKLRLDNNPYLSVVGEDAFSGLTSLQELEMKMTGLSSLDVRVLSQLPSLRVIHLEGNPWMCNCHFAKLFLWLSENRHKLRTGLEGMECSLPVDGRQVSLSMLSEDSFRECKGLLSLKDYLIVIFSGICISVAAIIASFFLASAIHCFQLLKAKRTDEEDGED
ncbi:leucine-rich repeat-containing protein 38 [Trichomycterus rosablanca]|uniref:leucine-rich repeat-containing protein 38 n=1 Tax=Trichomycterus rosablanca TaxID=2290929 RepID=UPI002F350543